jgi:enoyl-CoA hydratase/carnithine racemase
MAFNTITLETRNRIGTLTLNRPEKLNAMNPALIVELGEALTQIERDDEIKILVIRGAGRAMGRRQHQTLHDRR